MSDNKSADRLKGLTLLSANERRYPQNPEDARLETFENLYPENDYIITLCPVTGQPDFGHIIIRYIADKRCIESKSLKLYLFSFRNTPTFHEESVNRILKDIVQACNPRKAEVVGLFRPRGGIAINVKATFGGKIDE